MVILVFPVFIVPLPPCLGRDYGWACPRWVLGCLTLFLLQVWRLLFVTEPCFDETGCVCPISKVVVLLLECEVEQ